MLIFLVPLSYCSHFLSGFLSSTPSLAPYIGYFKVCVSVKGPFYSMNIGEHSTLVNLAACCCLSEIALGLYNLDHINSHVVILLFAVDSSPPAVDLCFERNFEVTNNGLLHKGNLLLYRYLKL